MFPPHDPPPPDSADAQALVVVLGRRTPAGTEPVGSTTDLATCIAVREQLTLEAYAVLRRVERAAPSPGLRAVPDRADG